MVYGFAKRYFNPFDKNDIDYYLIKHHYQAYTQDDLDKWQDDD
jgi:hypothetical protein